LRSPFAGFGFILAFRGLLSSAMTLIAGVPIYLLLRRFGRLGLGWFVVAGVVVGLLVAVALEPYLRGELVSIPLTPLHGAVLGAAVAVVFWALGVRGRGRVSSP
jgi:hypothetical protein